MTFFGQGLQQAWDLLLHNNAALLQVLVVTLKVAGLSTAIAVVVGVPAGVVLGLGRFRGVGVLRVLANVGLGLPPVVVGVTLALLMFPAAPLGRFHLIFTLRGVYVAQTVLAVPIIIALTSSAVRDVPRSLLDQARAYGASRRALGALATREARVGILAAVIAAVGSGLSEVGAVVLVGGNIEGVDQTLASAALERVNAGDFAGGLAIGILLLALILVITAALTWLQFGNRQEARVKAS
ncbi:ABC transporter permease [Nocardioides mangrovicus]|uniref:ABC transporter permease n=1 Tax=Nocardioides mangrovicus TaxID=2478913 RepID=UPI001314E9E1|nr:ABC transporter permease [Nocardioides mangrovicus]